jgi:hypothetical protein
MSVHAAPDVPVWGGRFAIDDGGQVRAKAY